MATALIPAALLRRVSVDAECDPRTIRRVLRGERVRGMVDDRIRRTLATHGITPPDPQREDSAA